MEKGLLERQPIASPFHEAVKLEDYQLVPLLKALRMPRVNLLIADLCRMLRLITQRFEHRLFLSAAPHNGHTRSFSGLLEILDPVRFSQTSELKSAEKSRIRQVAIRRLKREINERSELPRFCTRRPRD